MDDTASPITCPTCGAANDAAARFCHECGTPLHPDPDPTATADPPAPPPTALAPPPEPVAADPDDDPDHDPAPPPTPDRAAWPASPGPPPNLPDVAPPEASGWPAAQPPTPSIATAAIPAAPAGPVAPPSPRSAPPNGNAGDGNWLTTAPPRSVLIVGLILFLGACAILFSGQAAFREPIEPLLFCAAPVGFLLVLVAGVRLALRRPDRP